MGYLLVFIGGIVLGMITMALFDADDGTLYIDTSNEEKDLYLISFDEPLSELNKRNAIRLKVNAKADLSQKNPRC